MRESFLEAEDVLKRTKDVDKALELVPKWSQMNTSMMGRRQAAFLEAHHGATIEWAKRLGIPPNEWDNMPALLMDKAWHRQFNNSGLPREQVFHNILRENMKDIKHGDKAGIVRRLKKTYRDFYGLTDEPDPAEWTIINAWIKKHVQGLP